MGFRVDREAIDALAVSGATAGGGRIYQTQEANPPWQPRPFTTKEEYAISNALRLMAVPRDQIRSIAPPINPPFPPQFGYDSTQLTIDDVLDAGRFAPVIRSWVSGAPAVRRSTAYDVMWSGSARNATDPSLNPAG
jgi:hypothetical protein